MKLKFLLVYREKLKWIWFEKNWLRRIKKRFFIRGNLLKTSEIIELLIRRKNTINPNNFLTWLKDFQLKVNLNSIQNNKSVCLPSFKIQGQSFAYLWIHNNKRRFAADDSINLSRIKSLTSKTSPNKKLQICTNFMCSISFPENGYCIKDSKKYPGQTLTPRHTIDAILGLNDRCDNIGGECWKSINKVMSRNGILLVSHLNEPRRA